jgi:hypothetical protein
VPNRISRRTNWHGIWGKMMLRFDKSGEAEENNVPMSDQIL